MKASGVANFLVGLGIFIMVIGGIGGFGILVTADSLALCVGMIVSSFILGAFLLGMAEIINYQIKILCVLKNQSEQNIQKCPECGEMVVFMNGMCPNCGLPISQLKN